LALNQRAYRFILCDNGIEGLKYILKNKPDVVVVDFNLPDISGEEVYTRFIMNSNLHLLSNTPFIALTNNGHVDKSKLYSLGFSACFGKPFKPNELIDIIEDVIVTYQLKMDEVFFWETIREAKDFLERVVESSVDSIVTTDTKGIITYCNRASEEMIGYGFEELVGKRVSLFLEGGSTELLKIAAFLRKKNKVQNYKTLVIKKNGESIPVNLSISTMKNSDGTVMGALGISKVIGGEKYVEYDTNESERLAVIIETAVAVNHAINNPLVPILGNAQFLLQMENLQDEEVKRRLQIIVSNALRIRDITQKLARISHPVTKEYLRGTRMLDIEAST
jgi:PAS domain S-box-containing protein